MIKLKKLNLYGRIKSFNSTGIILILPIVLFNVFFFLGGIILGVKNSFGNTYLNNGWFLKGHFLFNSPLIIDSLLFTIKIACISTIGALIISLIILYFFYSELLSLDFGTRFLYLPVLTPYILVAFIMLYTFTTSGFLNRLLYHFQFIESLSTAPIYMNDPQGMGIILGYLWKSTPFFTLMLLTAFRSLDSRYLKISTSLGASKSTSFFMIILPQLKSSIIYATLIIFTFIFSSIELPLFLGPTRPQTLAVWAYQNFKNGPFENQSVTLAINTFLLCCNIFVVSFIGSKYLKEVTYEEDT